MAKRDGKSPAALASEPDLIFSAQPYFAAFKMLHGSRNIAPDGAPLPIPLSEVSAYADLFGFRSLQDRFDLLRYVQVCDNSYIEACKRRAPKQQHGKSGKHPKIRR